MDGDLLTLVQQNVNDLIDESNNIKAVLDQQNKQFASVKKQAAVLEGSQLFALMQQQELKLQEVEETLKRLLHCQKAVHERLSLQVQALQEGLAKTDDKVEQLEQGLTTMAGKVEHEVELLKQGLTAMTDKVEHLDQGAESLKMKDVKSG